MPRNPLSSRGLNLSPRLFRVWRVRSRIDAVGPNLGSNSFTGLHRVFQGFPGALNAAVRAQPVRSRLGQVELRTLLCRKGHLLPERSPSDPEREWCSWCRHDVGAWEPNVLDHWAWCWELIRGRS